MIAYVEGRLLAVGQRSVLLLTPGGVGYELFVSAPVLAQTAGSVGTDLSFFVRTIVREDAIELFGFASREEQILFDLLITVSKLGPKTALSILGHYNPEQLYSIAAGDDPALLAKVPGIGKKSAEHIFLELKYKLRGNAPFSVQGGAPPKSSLLTDALAGLVNLGYSEDEARPVLENAWREEPDLDAPALLRKALKAMGRARL